MLAHDTMKGNALFPFIKYHGHYTPVVLGQATSVARGQKLGTITVITEFSQGADSISSIDRSVLMCQPVVFEDITNEGIVERDLKRFQLDFMFSLGIKIDKEINQLIKEVYDK